MLLAHSAVLQRAIEVGPVLPLRFGVVLPDEETVAREVLEPRAPTLRARLDALEDKVEMQLKATFAEDVALRSVLADDEELARLAQRIRRLPPAATHFDRIRLGELVGLAVEALAVATARELTAALEPFALAVSIGNRHDEWMALNASFLVEGARREDFDAAVERLSQAHTDSLQFTLIGPLPAYSFAEHEWEKGVAWV
jgi:hypothetical protein